MLAIQVVASSKKFVAPKSNSDDANAPINDDVDTSSGLAATVKKHVKSVGGASIYLFTIARAASVLVLLCLTVVSFLHDDNGPASDLDQNGVEGHGRRALAEGLLGISYVRGIVPHPVLS